MPTTKDSFLSRIFRFILPGIYAFSHHDSVQSTPQNTNAFLGPRPKPVRRSRGFLFWLCAFLTLVVSWEMFYEFGSGGYVFAKENDLPNLYLMLLAAYAVDKEMGHWDSHLPENQIQKRKGEWFIIWWILFGTAIIYCNGRYQWNTVQPHELVFVLKGVIGIFLGGQASKWLRVQSVPQDAPARADSMPAAPADDAPDDDASADASPADSGETADLGQSILNLLQNYPDGLNATQIAEKLGVGRTSAQRALSPLLASGQVVKVSTGPRDPKTRYKLARFR